MRRFVILLVAVVLSAGLVAPVHAKRGAKKAKAVPMSEGISKEMDHLKWGMPLKKVVAHFTEAIKEKYRPLIAKTTHAMKEDELRHKMRNEIRSISDSVVRFDGDTTGWDVSFLKGEFTHGNSESMFVVRDGNSQNFYFFINNRLWKWYKAFDASVFDGANFERFSGAIEGRYGPSAKRKGEATPGAGERHWLEWQDKTTRLRAIDQTGFYGFYCLVFDDKKTIARLGELRRVKSRKTKDTHSMVEHVTTADEESGDDVHQDVVDRITGKVRNRQDAPEGSSPNRSGSSSSSSGGGSNSRADDLSDL